MYGVNTGHNRNNCFLAFIYADQCRSTDMTWTSPKKCSEDITGVHACKKSSYKEPAGDQQQMMKKVKTSILIRKKCICLWYTVPSQMKCHFTLNLQSLFCCPAASKCDKSSIISWNYWTAVSGYKEAAGDQQQKIQKRWHFVFYFKNDNFTTHYTGMVSCCHPQEIP